MLFCLENNKKKEIFIKEYFRILVLLLVLFLISCKASEAPISGFIKHPEKMKKDPSLPFQKVWFHHYFNIMNYSRIIISPVKLRYLLTQTKLERQNLRNYFDYKEEDDKYTADYFRKSFINTFKITKGNRFKVVGKRGYGTLVLNIAIVEIVPTKVSVNSVSGALMFVPFGSVLLSAAFSAVMLPVKTLIGGVTESGMKSYIAFEAVLKDSMTGKILATYADRESQQAALFSFKDYSYFSHIRGIIDIWAKQTVLMLNRKNNKIKIEDSDAFTFNPI